MNDRLVWDVGALRAMVAQLRNASKQLLDCESELKALCAAGEEMFKSNDGRSRRILEQMESVTYKTARTGEKNADIADALARAVEIFTETETSLQRTISALPVEAEASAAAPERKTIFTAVPMKKIVILGPGGRFPGLDFVPEWLSHAADKAFGL